MAASRSGQMKAVVNWRERYERLAIELRRAAPAAKPLLAGFNAFVDAVYAVDSGILSRLQTEARADKHAAAPGPQLAAEIVGRVRSGRGGALCLNWRAGPAWADRLFGEPAILQLGGTGPQAAWALATLGAPAIVALPIEATSSCRFCRAASSYARRGDWSKPPNCRFALHQASRGTSCSN